MFAGCIVSSGKWHRLKDVEINVSKRLKTEEYNVTFVHDLPFEDLKIERKQKSNGMQEQVLEVYEEDGIFVQPTFRKHFYRV